MEITDIFTTAADAAGVTAAVVPSTGIEIAAIPIGICIVAMVVMILIKKFKK